MSFVEFGIQSQYDQMEAPCYEDRISDASARAICDGGGRDRIFATEEPSPREGETGVDEKAAAKAREAGDELADGTERFTGVEEA